jgi:hypothetical protein
MKKTIKNSRILLFSIASTLLCVMNGNSQKIVPKENFQLLNPQAALTFVPFTKASVAKNATTKTESDIITLPNKKTVSLASYLKTINYLEKNLSDLGYARDRKENTIVISSFKSPVPNQVKMPSFSAPGVALSKTDLSNRFKISITSATATTRILPKVGANVVMDANKLPNDTITRNENFDIPKFNVGGYGVKINASYNMKGIVDPFRVANNQMNQDSLNRIIRNTSNEYQIGFNVNINTDLPGVGNFNIYKIESQFSSKANTSLKSKANLQVLDQLMIDEDLTSTGNSTSFVKQQVFNTEKKLGAADIYMYGLNAVSPVDFYINSQGIGAGFDMALTRSSVQGTITPIITQSIFLETSVSETLGPVADLVNATILDAGVGGELRLIQGGLDFGGNIGLVFENGLLKLKNDVYKSINVNLLSGRIYTFYTYPVYTCGLNIFEVGNLSCWAERRVENDLFNTGSAIKFQQVLVNDDKTQTLNW